MKRQNKIHNGGVNSLEVNNYRQRFSFKVTCLFRNVRVGREMWTALQTRERKEQLSSQHP